MPRAITMSKSELEAGVSSDWLEQTLPSDRAKIALNDPHDPVEIAGEKKIDNDESEDPKEDDYFYKRVPLEGLPKEFRDRKWVHSAKVIVMKYC